MMSSSTLSYSEKTTGFSSATFSASVRPFLRVALRATMSILSPSWNLTFSFFSTVKTTSPVFSSYLGAPTIWIGASGATTLVSATLPTKSKSAQSRPTVLGLKRYLAVVSAETLNLYLLTRPLWSSLATAFSLASRPLYARVSKRIASIPST